MKIVGFVSVALATLALTALSVQKTYEVKWAGELRKVMSGEDKGIISLDSLSGQPNLYAIGPLEGLNGEITVFNSEPVIATVRDGKPFIEDTFHVQAPLLVWAQVSKWVEVAIPSSVQSIADLDRFVGESAKKAGLDLTAPVPFRVTAHVHEIAMHIVNRRGQEIQGHADHEKIEVKIPLTHANVELLGFWSDRHQGVFTHMGSNVHIHGRTTDNKFSGHVDEVKIFSGKLWLPAAT
jgi:acetolactate decarboxylase